MTTQAPAAPPIDTEAAETSDLRTDADETLIIMPDFPGSNDGPLTDADHRRRAKDLVEELFEDRGLCPLCFARKRTFYPEFDLELANRLYRGTKKGANKLAFEGMGYQLREDGSLQVNSATSDADPSTYQEVVPPTWLNGKWRPPRSRTICECGTIDYDFDEARDTSMMYTAIENMSEHIEQQGYPFNLEAAKTMIKQAKFSPELGGRDRDVLEGAVYLGLKYADDDDDDPTETDTNTVEE